MHSPSPLAQALILAAGRGERMRPLTDHTPKPLLRVHGKPLLQWHSDALAAGGFARQLINAGWLSEQIAAFISDHSSHFDPSNLPEQLLKKKSYKEESSEEKSSNPRLVGLSNEQADFGHALETLGGIVRALPRLDPVFWVVAGDIYAPDFVFSQQAYQDFAASEQLAHVWLVPNPAHKPEGDFCVDADGLLRNLGAGADSATAATSYTFSTFALYKQAFFTENICSIAPGNPQGIAAPLAPLLRRAADLGQISASVYRGAWVDVGTPERLAALNASII